MTEAITHTARLPVETPWTGVRRAERPTVSGWSRWWPAGLLLSACLYAVTYLRAWSSDASGAHLLFWLASAVMVITIVGLVLSGPTRTSGFAASLSLGLLLYLPKLFHSPVFFNYLRRVGPLAGLEHLNAGGGLFFENPINKAVEFYPGLESAAGILTSATGLSEFVAGNIVIGALHALIAGALFLLYEQVADSPRVALLSVLVFAANPAFVFFDSYFAYESFALPLAASAVAAVVLSERMSRRTAYGLLGVAFALCLTVVISHHVTAWVLAGMLLLLGLGAIWERGWAWTFAKRLIAIGTATAAAVAAWLVLVAPYTLSYVGPTFSDTADAIGRFAGGSTQHRHLFYRSTEPFYEKYGSYLAVFLLAGAFAYAVLLLMRRDATRREHLTTPLILIGALYFISLPIAFLVSTNAVTRVWEFAFIGVAPLVAVALAELLLGAAAGQDRSDGCDVCDLPRGGRQPHQPRAGAARTVRADGRPPLDDGERARRLELARNNYGTDNVVIGDRTAFAVFGSYGNQKTLSGQNTGTHPGMPSSRGGSRTGSCMSSTTTRSSS